MALRDWGKERVGVSRVLLPFLCVFFCFCMFLRENSSNHQIQLSLGLACWTFGGGSLIGCKFRKETSNPQADNPNPKAGFGETRFCAGPERLGKALGIPLYGMGNVDGVEGFGGNVQHSDVICVVRSLG